MKQYMTTEGHGLILERIATLEQKLKEMLIEKAIAYEASGDGWHDNPGWIQIGQQEERLTKEIAILKSQLANATVLDNNVRNTETVQIGSIVRFQQQLAKQNREQVFEIVGSNESNISLKRIAYDTPIGKAILGARAGDDITFKAPAGLMAIKVLELYQHWEQAPPKLRKP